MGILTVRLSEDDRLVVRGPRRRVRDFRDVVATTKSVPVCHTQAGKQLPVSHCCMNADVELVPDSSFEDPCGGVIALRALRSQSAARDAQGLRFCFSNCAQGGAREAAGPYTTASNAAVGVASPFSR